MEGHVEYNEGPPEYNPPPFLFTGVPIALDPEDDDEGQMDGLEAGPGDPDLEHAEAHAGHHHVGVETENFEFEMTGPPQPPVLEPDEEDNMELPVDNFTHADEDEDDTTAEQYKQGKDLQGIPWDRLQFDRQRYRAARLENYRNYTNLLAENDGATYRELVAQESTPTTDDGKFFAFVRNHRSVQSTIVHFQLRNLVWAPSRHDVVLVRDNVLRHWSSVTRACDPVLDLSGGRSTQGAPGRVQGLGRVQVSTLCVAEGLVAAGGFSGELVVKPLDDRHFQGGDGLSSEPASTRAAAAASSSSSSSPPESGDSRRVLFSGRVTRSDNGITNAIEIFSNPAHGTRIMAANNDCLVRIFSPDPFTTESRFSYPWAVNYATLRPHSSLIAVVGDDPVTHLTDMNSGATVTRLRGHRDYSFAAAWHPDGYLLATGNQDTVTLLWDLRSPLAPLASLPGRMGAVRALRFSPDGAFLVASEPADFVHIYDVKSLCGGRGRRQEIDFFGEISGLSFSPCGSRLFIGVADITYSSLLVFDRVHGADRLGLMKAGMHSF